MEKTCTACLESEVNHDSGFCSDCFEAMTAPLPDLSHEEWQELQFLSESRPFPVKLNGALRTENQDMLFEAGEEFMVYPAILRFDDKVYEVADGYAKGFMLNVADCTPTFSN